MKNWWESYKAWFSCKNVENWNKYKVIKQTTKKKVSEEYLSKKKFIKKEINLSKKKRVSEELEHYII